MKDKDCVFGHSMTLFSIKYIHDYVLIISVIKSLYFGQNLNFLFKSSSSANKTSEGTSFKHKVRVDVILGA